MAGLATGGPYTTHQLPNYLGELFGLTPMDTPFLSMAGGLTGGEEVHATMFGWQTYDLRTASQNSRLEGAAAQTAEARVRAYVFNVVQIHQETIETTYTKQAAVAQLGTTGSAHTYNELGEGSNPVQDEQDWQVSQMIKQIARDVEYSFINGTFQEPSNNSTARQTRGILAAITTNATDKAATSLTGCTIETDDDLVTKTSHGLSAGDQVAFTSLTGGTGLSLEAYETYYVIATGITANAFSVSLTKGGSAVDITVDYSDATCQPLTEPTASMFLDLMQDVWDNGGIMEDETRTVFVNSGLKRYLTKFFITDQGYQEQTRNVGGVAVTVVETDFGRLNIVLERHMPKSEALVASMEHVAPVFLNIPGKGFLFREPLAKVGAGFRDQIYGEIGLKYGPELVHGKLTGLHGKYDPS